MFKRKRHEKTHQKNSQTAYPKRSIPIEEFRKAVDAFADDLLEGVHLSVLIKDDLTIDYHLLGPYLKAIPEETYYMSKETYEIFPESEYQLVKDMDMVQHAVDGYLEQTSELPLIDGDPYRKVNYFKLEKCNLLPRRPKRDFYITKEENLITYKKPI